MLTGLIIYGFGFCWSLVFNLSALNKVKDVLINWKRDGNDEYRESDRLTYSILKASIIFNFFYPITIPFYYLVKVINRRDFLQN